MRFNDIESLEAGLAVFKLLGVDPATVTGGEFTVKAVGESEVMVRWSSFAIASAAEVAEALTHPPPERV